MHLAVRDGQKVIFLFFFFPSHSVCLDTDGESRLLSGGTFCPNIYISLSLLLMSEFYQSHVCDCSLIPLRHNKWISTSSLTQSSLLTILTLSGVGKGQAQFSTVSC